MDKQETPCLSEEASILTDLKVMYTSEDNLLDLKLELKNNLTSSAHKFIMCARSDVLKDLILTDTSKDLKGPS